MKKFTSMFVLLLLMLIGTTAKAQQWIVDDEADGLITDASQITSNCSEPSEGSIEGLLDGDASTFWHSKWSGGNAAQGSHSFQVDNVEGIEEYFGFVFTRRNAANDQIIKWGVYGVPEGLDCNADKSELTKLAIVETPYTSGELGPFTSVAIASKGFKSFRFYNEEATGSNYGDRGYWHCAEFQLKPCKQVDDIDFWKNELSNVYGQYSVYSETFPTGTGYGQYGEAEVAAFEAALLKAVEIGDGDGTYTSDEIKAATEAIKTTYEAVIASRKPYAMEVKPGYYVIKSALDFKTSTTTEDTEDPETGETIPGETITTHKVKAMCDYAGTTAAWFEFEEKADFLFEVKATDKKNEYRLINKFHDLTFAPVSTSSNIAMVDRDSTFCFDWAADDITVYNTDGTEKKVTAFNLRLAAQAERGGVYIHAGGHGGGTGNYGNLVGWYNTTSDTGCGASEWYLEEIDAATAEKWIEAASPIKVIASMIDSVATIKNAFPAQKKIAEDKTAILDSENPLIKESSQFHSPMTTTDEQCDTEEEVYTYLLDGNTGTYWHSAWEGGDRTPGSDYLEVSDIDAENIAFQITRRAATNDHPSVFSVYGYDESNDELAKTDGVLLATCEIGYESNTETKTSDVFATQGKKVLRFYAEETQPIAYNRGYWHASEFQIYPATVGYGAETTQATVLAAEIKALEEALAAWTAKGYTTENVEDPNDADFVAAYNAVVKAYAAWQAAYADPTALRSTMAANANVDKMIVTGNNPGQWPAGTTADALNKAIETAKAYSNAGKYSEDGLQKNIDAIVNAKSDLFAKANKVQTGKWYKFRMPTEAECEQNGWDKICEPVLNEDETENTPALYGRYISTGNRLSENSVYTFEGIGADEVTIGATLYFMGKDDVIDDGDMFQFIAVGDTAYIMQNKATGLFVKTGNSGAARLSIMPSLFKPSVLGYGANLIESVQFDEKYQHCNLHGQREGGIVCTWEANTAGSRSSIMIEEAGDVTGYTAPDAQYNVYNGRTYPMCWPVEVKLTDDDAAIYGASVEGSTVTLLPIKDNTVKAGTPFILISNLASCDEATGYVKEAEDEGVAERYRNVTLAVTNTQINKVPATWNALVGNYYGDKTAVGDLVAKENGFSIATSTATVGANEAYIKAGIVEGDQWPTITIEISGSEVEADNISTVLSNVAKGGKIYTIDGKFVGNGNINTIKNMGRGIYVINGVKIAVK